MRLTIFGSGYVGLVAGACIPQSGLMLCESAHLALEGADALAIVTERQEFRGPDFLNLEKILADAVVFDGRNLYEPQMVEDFGLRYYAIGRGATSHRT